MLVAVVSDTHGQLEFTRQAVRLLESFPVEVVLHCGDIGSADVVRAFAPWPTHFVFGNTDHDRPALQRAIIAAGQTCHQSFGRLLLGGVRIALLHGDDGAALADAIDSGQWDVVCHGHTHVERRERIGQTLVLNPGALYRANPHSLALLKLPERSVTPLWL